jgi:hypothetical protein
MGNGGNGSNGITVIFGTVRTTTTPSESSGLSGPPGGTWAQACAAAPARRRGRARSLAHDSSSVFDHTFKGRNFERRVRTFVG